MNNYIILLRAINVGGKNKLPMKNLIFYLENLGCKNIKTYIQSGNVILDSPDEPDQLKNKIKSIINKEAFFIPEIMILYSESFTKIIEQNPYPTEDGKLLHFYFFNDKCSITDQLLITKYKSETEQFEIHNKVLYLYAPDGIGRSKFVPRIESLTGQVTTGRNFNTILKLQNLIS